MPCRACLLGAVAILLAPAVASAQSAPRGSYPLRTIRLVIPTVAGGSLDIVSRLMAQKLGESFGLQVIADNRPGASAMVGSEIVARAAADGYTVLMGYSAHAVNPSLFKKLPYDTLKDFVPVTLVIAQTLLMVAHPSLPARSVKDVLALARAKPGELNYASPGSGAAGHLAGELFKSMAQINLLHVPYKGGAPATLDLLSGHVTLMFNGMPVALPHVKAGKLRALAVSTARRSQVLPDVQSVAETVPGYDVMEWNGLFVPAGTPAPIVNRLHAEISAILQVAEVRERLSSQGADPVGSSPDEFAAFVRSETVKWAKVVKDAGIGAD